MLFPIPFRHLSCFSVLLTIILVCTACTQTAINPGITGTDTAPEENGIYAVLREADTLKAVRESDSHGVVLPYDGKYTGTGTGETLRYVSIAPDSFVPMILEGAPDAKQDTDGKTILSVTLRKEHVKTLEDFTQSQIGGKLAILIDGEIITIHKVRSVISDGRFQVSRCTDNACEILRAKLDQEGDAPA